MGSNVRDWVNGIQKEIYEWSLENFGDQKGLNHFAPLVGIGEEIGELCEAIANNNKEGIEDAVGDVLIYSFDCTARYGLEASVFWPLKPRQTHCTPSDLVQTLGRVNHAFLKTHQGIRGFDDTAKAGLAIRQAMLDLMINVGYYADIRIALSDTWRSVVSKRNWKPDAKAEKS